MKVVLLNGSAGSGKDTLVNLITTYLRFEFEIRNISTIDKVKKIAKEMGWDVDIKWKEEFKTLEVNYSNGTVDNYIILEREIVKR